MTNVKYKGWEHENEWRYLTYLKDAEYDPFKKEYTLSGIFSILYFLEWTHTIETPF